MAEGDDFGFYSHNFPELPPGNGCDQSAQRNGLVLAANAVATMGEPLVIPGDED